MFALSFNIPVEEVLSENFLYKPGFKNRHSYLYLDPKIARYKEQIATFIKNNYDLSCIPDGVTGIVSEYRFFVNPESFWSRDVTNAVKAVEDSIFSVFRKINSSFDDSMVISNIATKIPSKTPEIMASYLFLDDQDQNLFVMRHSITDFLTGFTAG